MTEDFVTNIFTSFKNLRPKTHFDIKYVVPDFLLCLPLLKKCGFTCIFVIYSPRI